MRMGHIIGKTFASITIKIALLIQYYLHQIKSKNEPKSEFKNGMYYFRFPKELFTNL